MTDVTRLRAAQAKADEIVATVGDHDGSNSPKLRVSVTDTVTGQRMATGFAAYTVPSTRPTLHVVEDQDPLDGTEFGGILADLDNIHPLIDDLRTTLAALATTRFTREQSQVIAAALNGSPDSTDVVGAIGHLLAHLTDPTTNPALRDLPDGQQKEAQHQGQLTAFALTDPDLRTTTSEAIAALDT